MVFGVVESPGPDARSGIVHAVSVAPCAVVRVSALAPPADPRLVEDFRRHSARLVERLRWCAEHSESLTAVLHDRAGACTSDAGSAAGHRRALVSLRRDVHNCRSSRPALQAALAAVPDLPPLASAWLQARGEIDTLTADLTERAPAVLAAERAVLAELCRAEPLRRAVATISENLLRAVSRTAEQGGRPDERCRKSEHTVLRYALRATTRTSPLSWFTLVGWGRWVDEDEPTGPVTAADSGRAMPAWDVVRTGDDAIIGAGLRVGQDVHACAVARPDRRLVDRLIVQLVGWPDLNEHFGHRLAPGLRVDGGRLRFRRPTPTDDPKAIAGEQDLALPLTGPLRLVLDRAGSGVIQLAELTAALAVRMAGPPEQARVAAGRYVVSLVRAGLLQPCAPVDPQELDCLGALATWFGGIASSTTSAETGRAAAEMAGTLADLDRQTRAYAATPAGRRPAELARLRHAWDAALAAAASLR